jgi:hypothetical protein
MAVSHSGYSFFVAAAVVMTAGCNHTASPPPPPPDAITISLSADSVTFADTVGTATSPSITVAVTRGDTADVDIGAVTYGDATGGWLTFSLDRTTTPAVLTLQP